MTRARLLLLLSFLVACDEEIPVLDQRDGGGRDAGIDAETDASTETRSDAGARDAGPEDAGPEDPLVTEARERAESACTYLQRCSPATFTMTWFTFEDCMRRRLPIEEDQLRRGFSIADPEACRVGADHDCDGLPDDPVAYERCVVAPGPRAEGESCSDSFECGLSEDGRRMGCTGCDGVCLPFLEVGDTCSTGPRLCDVERDSECLPSEDGVWRCHQFPRVGPGEPCDEARCALGYACHPETRVCAVPPVVGELCSEQCAGGIDVVCTTDETGMGERRCRENAVPPAPGQPCAPEQLCAGLARCPESGLCPTSCLEGLSCFFDSVCDPGTGRCEADLTCREP